MTDQLTKVGRLALRQEGDLWVAYYAEPDKMEGAIYLGSIQIALVENNPDRKQQFMDLMRAVVGDMIGKIVGVRPHWPEGTQPAPEHERGAYVRNRFLK
jgi:hypothetical protein